MNPINPITPSGLGHTKSTEVVDDPRISRKQRNRKRAEKLIQDSLAQATAAGQSAQYSTPQFEAPGLQPLQPLGDFNGANSGLPNMSPIDPDNTDSDGVMGLDSRFSSNVEQMMADAPGSVSIYSGRRSTDRQAELWQQALQKYGNEAEARRWVAPPRGHRLSDGSVAQGSRHESGLAADLKYENDATKRWVHENAHRYGLHFPLDNEDWHVEPIGSRG